MSAADLYQELIVAHAKVPRYPAIPEGASITRRDNPMCGDRIDIGTIVLGSKLISMGALIRGCALCVASASMMSEVVTGMHIESIHSLAAQFIASLDKQTDKQTTAKINQTAVSLGDLDAFQGVREVPSRKKCATLPWEALLAALNDSPGTCSEILAQTEPMT